MKNNYEEPFSEISDESLDDLLQAAAWQDPDPARLGHLQEQWKQYARRRGKDRWRHWTAIVAAMAAGLLISATLWTIRKNSSKNMPPVVEAHEPKIVSPIPDHPKHGDTVNKDAMPEKTQVPETLPISRPPTPYEQLIFRVAIDKRKAAIKAFRAQSKDRTIEPEENPKENPPDHATAVLSLLPRADANELARLAVSEENLELQEEIFAALLTRGDAQSVGIYLDFVFQRNYADRALSALNRKGNPPVEILFDFLRGVHVPRRLAAAMILGRIDGPDTAQKLFQMVRGNVSRQEAMVALLASPGEEASHYVNLAKQDISLAGILNGAQYQYRLISSTQ